MTYFTLTREDISMNFIKEPPKTDAVATVFDRLIAPLLSFTRRDPIYYDRI